MNNYIVTKAFDVPMLDLEVPIGTIVSKLNTKVDSFIGALEWSNQAFWEWLGSAGSAGYMTFTGSVPDPSSIIAIAGSIDLVMGQDYYDYTGAGFWFAPQVGVITIVKPTPTSANLFVVLRAGTLTTDGFIVDFSSPIPTTGYKLNYVVFQ